MNLTVSAFMPPGSSFPKQRAELKASQLLLFSNMCLWPFLRSPVIGCQPGLDATAKAPSSPCPTCFHFAAIVNRASVSTLVLSVDLMCLSYGSLPWLGTEVCRNFRLSSAVCSG